MEGEASQASECRAGSQGPRCSALPRAEGRTWRQLVLLGHGSVSWQVMEVRTKLHSENRKTAVKQEAIPDLEDSPPVSDSDVSTGASRATKAGGRPLPSFSGA